jgi:hypothetical protein
MGRLSDELKKSAASMAGLSAWLDELDHQTRVDEVRSLGGAAQKRLWELARDEHARIDEMVTPETASLTPVIHFGRNTLPVFKIFEKRFCRPPADVTENVLWGYNEGSTRCLVGPGYFVCRETGGDERGTVVIDYTLLPESKPDSWPAISPNEKFPSVLVYAGMHDFMRRVSTHVTIGRAWRKGKMTDNYFMLCREA